ncbi:patatin-like phospholipase family protein [Candidatus Enterococcus mansonii]|uniref:PNPLA domain-containing protein n=1 Tax=Candidatus Enterococcus mansonii TaxID=1834181 RepID=A0A242CEI9_9ENTE|nr:patatin-like phospholipase family protein [Enterococcus sp. 4G2_DIV0659]OTO08626.1 hypothetical protein A5880_001626 [Enterococcus sp. 4G2_DIV0659]
MEVEQIYASQWVDYSRKIAESRMVLPFYETHGKARQAFSEKIRNNSGVTYVFYKRKVPYCFITIEHCEVTNLLMPEFSAVSWSSLFRAIETFFKRTFQPRIYLSFFHSLTPYVQEICLKQGYTIQENKFASKELTYHTALVLGGGGARGAYQVGVWQALKELAVPIAMITGTSVGALNGALILQDDLSAAKEMWEKIETQKILSYPNIETSINTFGGIMSQIGSFTLSAIQSKGVSTLPLQKLIEATFSSEKMNQVTTDFYLVTTELPALKEKNVHFNSCENDQWQRWLLASASFFPAMAATKIKDNYYIDGGYRNNIPIDIALRKGATECIVVDVKGPGITKPLKRSDDVSYLTLQTPWSMGAVLLFDGARSALNIQLGYLETMKAVGRKYLGFWYTFDETLTNIKNFQQAFFTFIQHTYQIKLWRSIEERNKICNKMRKLYKDRVYTENIGLVLVELLAKNSDIPAAEVYTIKELADLLKQRGTSTLDNTKGLAMMSVQEWLKKYYEEYFLLSEKQQLSAMTNFLATTKQEKSQQLNFLLDKLPIQTLQILMNEFIEEGVNE